MLKIYCDGSYSARTGRGGWACVIKKRDRVWRIADGGASNSHNLSEINAAMLALEWVNKPSEVRIITDSTWLEGVFSQMPGIFGKKAFKQRPQSRQLLKLWELCKPHKVSMRWAKRCSTVELVEADFLAGYKCHGSKGIAEDIAFKELTYQK